MRFPLGKVVSRLKCFIELLPRLPLPAKSRGHGGLDKKTRGRFFLDVNSAGISISEGFVAVK